MILVDSILSVAVCMPCMGEQPLFEYQNYRMDRVPVILSLISNKKIQLEPYSFEALLSSVN